jgi:EmrB/QacA subfamily drug resistance transporter
MTLLDATVVNVAIDALSSELAAPLPTIQWVATGYLLALTAAIPLTGWAADRFGTKRLYVVSLALFVGGSVLCGVAWSAESLIAFRVVQGLGGGMIAPAGITILAHAAGPGRIGRVMSVVGVPMLIGPMLGPALGGWLVEASWRWIFYVNVPLGLVAIALALRVLARDVPQPTQRLDVRGMLLLSPGLTAFVLGLVETASRGGVDAPRAFLPLGTGVVLLGLFVVHALRTAHPLIDLRLFAQRMPRLAGLTMAPLGAAFFGAMLLMPLYYQVARGMSALEAGLMIVPQGLGGALMMPLSGRVVDRTGAARIVVPGFALTLAGMLVFATVGPDTSLWALGAAAFATGAGVGATMTPTMAAALQTLQRVEVARATTAFSIVQRGGGAVGTALLSVVLANELAQRLPGNVGREQALAAARDPLAAQAQAAPLVAEAFGHAFWWAVALLVLGAIPAVLLPWRRRQRATAPASDAPPSDAAVEPARG